MKAKPQFAGLLLFLAACGQPTPVSGEGSGHQTPSQKMRVAPLLMPGPRAAHSAVPLADGRVLLLGGCVAESCEAGPASATVDIFDPSKQSFKPAGVLTSRRVSTATALLQNGMVLVAGGWVGSTVSSSVELFDPNTGQSKEIGALSAPRADVATVALHNGDVLFIGGYGSGEASAGVDVYDASTTVVRSAGELRTARAGAGAALLDDGRVLVVGGGTTSQGRLAPTATAEIFDPKTGKSVATGSLAVARYKHATVRLRDGRVLVVGGSDERDSRGKLRSIEVFQPGRARFEAAGEMLEARFKIGGAVVELPNGKVVIAGGGHRPELYDPKTLTSVAFDRS